MSQEITMQGFDDLQRRFDKVIREESKKRRQIHLKLNDLMKEQVDDEILDSGLRDRHGKVRSWQGKFPGSGGGYAAVRAISGKNEYGYAYGYITNALENGHRVRRSYRLGYVSKSRRFTVEGYGFYDNARFMLKTWSRMGAEELAEWVRDVLEGRET